MLEALERLAHDQEVRCGDRVLDHGEQLALLESDVLGEALGRFVKDIWFGGDVGTELVGAAADLDVIAKRAGDEGW